MLDRQARSALAPTLARSAALLERAGATPTQLTIAGFAVGALAVVAAGAAAWWLALALWLVNRLVDGLDGALARATGAMTPLGGFADVVADFTVYGAFVVGCAVGQPDARLAALVLLATYYVNGVAFLALDGIAGRQDIDLGAADGRSFVFVRSLTEGFETVVAHALFVLVPSRMAPLMWGFSALVLVSIAQRMVAARRALG